MIVGGLGISKKSKFDHLTTRGAGSSLPTTGSPNRAALNNGSFGLFGKSPKKQMQAYS